MAQQKSGAQKRKEKAEREKAEAQRERERSGADAEHEALIAKLGSPSLDPQGNQEWANNAAAAMAYITLNDATIPRETRFKQAADFIDRIASTRSPASTAKQIRDLKRKAGMTDEPASKTNALVPVGAGRTLRASKPVQ